MISLTTGPSNNYKVMRALCMRFKILITRELVLFKNNKQSESELVINGMKLTEELKSDLDNVKLDEHEAIERNQFINYIMESLDQEFDSIVLNLSTKLL